MTNLPVPKPEKMISETSCSPQASRARVEVGLRAKAILDQFWQDRDTPKAQQVLELQGWVDVLEPFTEDEVRDAWAAYQIGGPRSAAGRLYRPDAGALALIIKAIRRGVSQADPVALCERAFNPTAADRGLGKPGSWEERVQ